MAGVREWGWVWQVEIRWYRLSPHPVWRWQRLLQVASPGELREVVLAARADPTIESYRYRRQQRLLGVEPQSCPAGHDWFEPPPGSPTYWHVCGSCPGHVVYRCAECALWVLDPPLTGSCTRFDPAAYPRWRWT